MAGPANESRATKSQTILQELGYIVVCKEFGKDVLSYLQTHSIDLLLLGMNG